MISYSGVKRAAALMLLVSALSWVRVQTEGASNQSNPSQKLQERMMRVGEQTQEAYYSDGWSPHSLVPTFTDREQGDEMVALASDSEPYVTRLLANKTLQAAPVRDPNLPGGRFKETSKKQSAFGEEYYSDDDGTEDESEQPRLSAGELEHSTYPFERREPKQLSAQPPLVTYRDQTSDDAPIVNKSQEISNSWLPKVNDQVSPNESNKFEQPSTRTNPPQPAWASKKQVTSEKLASILGGSRESLTAVGKTDAAIEYLKNVLRLKQSRGNNSTRPTLPVANSPSPINYTEPDKQANLQRLSLFASRLSKLLGNASIPQADESTRKAAISFQQNASPALRSETKFKIADAKASQIPTSAAIQPPTDDKYHNYEYEHAQIDPSNGTPVGGDYFESQDEFLRGSARYVQSPPIIPEATSLEQAGKDQMSQSETGLSQSYLEPRKPIEPTYEIRPPHQLPSSQPTSLRFFRMARPEVAAPQLSSRIPLNYQQYEVKQTSLQEVLETNKLLKSTKNSTEQRVPGATNSISGLPETSRRPLAASKIYGREQPIVAPVIHEQYPKAPKIVSYNYFESPSDGGERDTSATNFKLGDALYSSTGGLEHKLSNSELEAIQNQFSTAEHPVLGVNGEYNEPQTSIDASLATLLDNLKSDPLAPERAYGKSVLDAQVGDFSRELANIKLKGVPQAIQPLQLDSSHQARPTKKDEGETDSRKKNLIVYLNHPRPDDMSKPVDHPRGDSDAYSEQYVAAKEFDSQGISKDSKYLDVADLSDYSELKGLQDKDKDGLSVVVIGDAYKYKKIVLLISSKAGGLKFIPMVKDNRK